MTETKRILDAAGFVTRKLVEEGVATSLGCPAKAEVVYVLNLDGCRETTHLNIQTAGFEKD